MKDRKGDVEARFYIDESTLTQHSIDFTDGSFIQYGYVWIFDREDDSVFSEMGDFRVSWVRADVAPFHCAALNAHDKREKEEPR